MRDKIIVALDVNNKESLLRLLNGLGSEATYIKIGMECFYSLGLGTVQMAKDSGLKVFLDLKLHDIPNTVENSVYSLCKLGADMLNVHALGGLEMMKAAKRGAERAKKDLNLPSSPRIIAVTHLTSLQENTLKKELGINRSLNDSVLSLAQLAQIAGLDGVVCSAHEAAIIKNKIGDGFITVTPGIRPLGNGPYSEHHDQKRVMTPKMAIDNGSDYLVIGRPITQSNSPVQTYLKVLEEISHGNK